MTNSLQLLFCGFYSKVAVIPSGDSKRQISMFTAYALHLLRPRAKLSLKVRLPMELNYSDKEVSTDDKINKTDSVLVINIMC